MSVRIMTAVWDHGPSEPHMRFMLLAVADSANDDGGIAWPSVATLGRKCAVSEQAARRTLHRLATEGWISVVMKPGRSNQYVIGTANWPTPVVGDTPVVDGSPVVDDSPAPVVDGRGPYRGRQANHKEPPVEPSADLVVADAPTLPEMPSEPERFNGGTLVAAWSRGWSSTHDGAQPIPTQTKRVGKSAKQIAADLTRDEDRDAAEALAFTAGCDGFLDLVLALGKYGANGHRKTTAREVPWWVQHLASSRTVGE